MTPEAAKAMYRRQVENHGTVMLRRIGPNGVTVKEVALRARVTDYEPHEMVGDIQQGDRRVIALAEDIGDFPLPIQKNGADRIVFGGKVSTVRAVDDRKRSAMGALIAYEIRIRGA